MTLITGYEENDASKASALKEVTVVTHGNKSYLCVDSGLGYEDITVAVASGTGTADTTEGTYKIVGWFVKAPSSATVYDFEILDSDGFPVVKNRERTGDQGIVGFEIPVVSDVLTVNITSATEDGDFEVRLRYIRS